jgi:hypothetical protein
MVRSRHPGDDGKVLAGCPLGDGEDAGPIVAPIADAGRQQPLQPPAVTDPPFLPDAGFIFKPEFDPLAGMGLAAAVSASSSPFSEQRLRSGTGLRMHRRTFGRDSPMHRSTRVRLDGWQVLPKRTSLEGTARAASTPKRRWSGDRDPERPRQQTRLPRPPPASAAGDPAAGHEAQQALGVAGGSASRSNCLSIPASAVVSARVMPCSITLHRKGDSKALAMASSPTLARPCPVVPARRLRRPQIIPDPERSSNGVPHIWWRTRNGNQHPRKSIRRVISTAHRHDTCYPGSAQPAPPEPIAWPEQPTYVASSPLPGIP